MDSVFELRWGFLSTGWIATMFLRDLRLDPASTRQVTDVKHRLTAICSRSRASAAKLAREEYPEQADTVTLYDDLDTFLKDKNVDVVYIASPMANHYEHARRCILAGKNVLCEKAATVNAAQAAALGELAKEHKVFIMEAVWTRFLPCAVRALEILDGGVLGEIKHVSSEYIMDNGIDQLDESHRLLDRNAGGGALLDLGPYAWVWIALSLQRARLDQTPASEPLPLPKVQGHMNPLAYSSPNRTSGQVDESVCAFLVFPPLTPGRAPVTAMLRAAFTWTPTSTHPAVTITGTKGALTIAYTPSRPRELTLEMYDLERPPDAVPMAKTNVNRQTETFDHGLARGFVWEMDEVARCIRDGKTASERMPWRETVLQMAIFDEIRRQNDWKFSEDLEKS